MLRALILGSSAVAVLALASGPTPGYAQETATMCNTVVDSEGDPVVQNEAEGDIAADDTAHTYDCPEAELQPVAQIEPAAPPLDALPASGVIYFDLDRAELNSEGAASLADIIDEIKGRQLGGITVGGHTDTRAPPSIT